MTGNWTIIARKLWVKNPMFSLGVVTVISHNMTATFMCHTYINYAAFQLLVGPTISRFSNVGFNFIFITKLQQVGKPNKISKF